MKIFKICKNFALAGAVALPLAGCGPAHEMFAEVGRSILGPPQEVAFADVSKVMTEQLSKEFAHLTFRQDTYRKSMRPTLVFDGRAAQILVATKPRLWSRGFSGDDVKMRGLAITRNDRYFTFTYESPLRDYDAPVLLAQPACVAASCRKFSDMEQLSRQEAMSWFYYSDEFTPEKFKAIFGEDAPAKEEQA